MKKLILALSVGVVVVVGAAAAYYRYIKPKRPNVILLMLDTTRADHLGYFGYERDTSPNIDAFARETVVFKHAMASAPWTPSSVATMFTGLYASTHGMIPPDLRIEAQRKAQRLRDNLVTMAEILRQTGYATYAISPNPWITPVFGYSQGFDEFKYFARARANKVTDEAIAAAEKFQGVGKPFFLYVHYLDPHDPYDAPGEFRDKFTGPIPGREEDPSQVSRLARYDGEIAFLDHHIGRLFDYLKKSGLYEDAIILLVADHGEQFMEHGEIRHGKMLFNEEVHVPVMLKIGQAHREVDATVSLVDILPTLLDALHLRVPAGVQGISLLNDENARGREGVFSEINRRRDLKAFIRYDGMKIIYDYGAPRKNATVPESIQVFDSRRDLRERQPVEDEAVAASLKQEYAKMYAMVTGQAPAGETAEAAADISDETIEQLKSMGYMQ